MEEADTSLCPQKFRFRMPSDKDAYVTESQNTPMSGESRAFVILDAKEVPPLPCGTDDVLIVVSDSKKLEDPRASRVLNFPKLKSFDDNNDVVKWIVKEGKAFNVGLEKIAPALFLNCGTGLRKLSSEIAKLAVLTRPGNAVAPDDARSVICFCAELTPKYVIDAICDGHTARALAFLDKLQDQGDETGWVLAYMQRHVWQQLQMEAQVASGSLPSDSAATLGVHPFIYKKMLERRQGLWARPSLEKSYLTLCDLDIAHKRGNPCAKHGLEVEVIRLSEEAKNVKR